jgi:hypothetical protein
MAGQHSVAPPSAFDIIAHCSAYIPLRQGYLDEPDSEESMQGTAAHWVATELACNRVWPVDTIAPNGILVDDEMLEGAQLYADFIHGLHDVEGFSEVPVAIKRIHEHCWGTPDYHSCRLRVDTALNRIRVVDYKYGHLLVEVYECLQLIGYGVGVMEKFGLIDTETEFEFTIVQPRGFHRDGPVRTWTGNMASLRPLVNNLSHMVAESLSGNAVARTGNHCTFCEARVDCKANQEMVGTIFDFTRMPELQLHRPGDIGRELRLLHMAQARLNARVEGLEQQALSLVQRSTRVPFYGIGWSQPRARWNATVEEVEGLGRMLGVDGLVKPRELIPVGQAKTKFKKALVDEAVIREYTFTPPGAAKLVADNTTDFRKIFDHG